MAGIYYGDFMNSSVAPALGSIDSAVKLNLGGGSTVIDGTVNVDRKTGGEVFPLAYADNSVNEIRASHVLEHFGHEHVGTVLKDWVRALKPGGCLKVAVPNFEWIAENYLAGKEIPVQGYVMGGHVDSNDYHRAIFDYETLYDALVDAGLCGITHWNDGVEDCSALPVSLNLCGTKPPETWPKLHACLSIPRLGFNDFWARALDVCSAFRIPLNRYTGAYWEQGLTKSINDALEFSPDYILTLDYDTIFDKSTLQNLLCVAVRNPEADAIAAIQMHRNGAAALFTKKNADGKNFNRLGIDQFGGDLLPIDTAHFGFTLIKAEKIRALAKPWFFGTPSEKGEWDDDRIDADISFWRHWKAAGNQAYLACHVPVGHLETMVMWPGRDLQPIYQRCAEYQTDGLPKEIWR